MIVDHIIGKWLWVIVKHNNVIGLYSGYILSQQSFVGLRSSLSCCSVAETAETILNHTLEIRLLFVHVTSELANWNITTFSAFFLQKIRVEKNICPPKHISELTGPENVNIFFNPNVSSQNLSRVISQSSLSSQTKFSGMN